MHRWQALQQPGCQLPPTSEYDESSFQAEGRAAILAAPPARDARCSREHTREKDAACFILQGQGEEAPKPGAQATGSAVCMGTGRAQGVSTRPGAAGQRGEGREAAQRRAPGATNAAAQGTGRHRPGGRAGGASGPAAALLRRLHQPRPQQVD